MRPFLLGFREGAMQPVRVLEGCLRPYRLGISVAAIRRETGLQPLKKGAQFDPIQQRAVPRFSPQPTCRSKAAHQLRDGSP